jgi:hypothetical protein
MFLPCLEPHRYAVVSMRIVLLLAVFSSSVLAQRVVFPIFSGPKAAIVRKQLTDQMCESLECLAATTSVKRGKPDFKAAKKQRVEFFVPGKIVKSRKQTTLQLVIFDAKGKTLSKKSFDLVKGALTLKSLTQAADFLSGKLQPKAPEPKSATNAPEQVPDTEEPVAKPVAKTEKAPPQKPTQVAEAEQRVKIEPDENPSPRLQSNKPPVVVADLSLELINRKFDYLEAQSAQLKRYDLPLYPAPAINVQFYPLALMRSDALAGLGLELGLSIAPYLRSRPSIEESYPTSATRFDAALTFRAIPFSFPMEIRPFLGIRSQSFVISQVNNVGISDLPNLSFLGLRFGSHLEVPVVANVLSIFGHVALNPVLSSSEIIGSTYFKSGSNFGFDFGLGLGVWVLPILQIRAGFDFNSYSLNFNLSPEDVYVAKGAYDRYISGTVGLRLKL